MSNKSPIYGFCSAGCRVETVRKEDFDRSATFVPVGLEGGEIIIEPYIKYRIKTNIINGAYDCNIKIILADSNDPSMIYHEHEVDIGSVFKKYRDYFYFEFVDWGYRDADEDEEYGSHYITYELNGVVNTYEYSDETSYDELNIYIINAKEVYRFNEDAEIVAKDGKDGKDGVGVPEVTADDNDKILRVVGGKWMAVEDDNAIPIFDLSARGLPAIAPDGEYVMVETDTTDILAALNKGAVKFIVGFNVGVEIEVSLIMSPACVTASGEYSCSSINEFNGSMMITTISAADGGILVKCTPMDNIIGAYINIALGGEY